ncbi:MAG: hypothetical protein O2782_20765 [bacterium]|nr:hypothetical protein [bacterium]
MVALSLGLLLVMVAMALLLADMERKRRTIVDLLDQLAPMMARRRRLTLANLRRLSRSPVHAYSLIDPIEREIGFLESEHSVTPDADDRRRTSLFAGSRLADFEVRLQTLAAVVVAADSAAPGAASGPGPDAAKSA